MKYKYLNMFKKIFLILMVFTLIVSAVAQPAAAGDYYLTDDELYLQYMPKAYDVSDVILSMNNQKIVLSSPSDLYVDPNDNVYITDTGNNRVIKLNSDMEYVMSYPNEKSGKKGKLNSPNGTYVDKDGDLYVADTENGRIVHFAADGRFVEEFKKPTEETYDSSRKFEPTKVYVDDFGIIYVINREDYHGIITLDSQGKFIAYVGTIKVKYDFVRSLVRMFGTESQNEQVGKTSPPYYSNMSINGDGTIYATSQLEEKTQIKRLTPSGSNVYADREFGEENKKSEYNFMPSFIDLAVTSDGIVFAADVASSKIYICDQQGNNIATFGEVGQTKLKFQLISSIAVTSKNDVLVLDQTLGTVQKISPTDFMKNIFLATTYYNNGKYEESLSYWQKVLKMCPTYKQGQIGVAKSLLRSGNSKEALELYKKALDKDGYSEAFEQIRSDFYRDHFGIIVLVIVASLFLLLFVISKLRKYATKVADTRAPENDKFGAKFFIETVVCVIFHPMDAFYRIKYNRKALRVWPILLMLAILFVEKLLFRKMIHFPFSNSVVYVDYFRDLVLFFLPLISWIIVAYAISSIRDGKQTFIETASSTLYSFVPYMILYLPITGLSNIMANSESGLYYGMQTILMIWCLILIYLNFKILNEYSFGKVVGTIFITLFGIVCLWIICFLFYIIVSQLFTFIGDLYSEFIYMNK